MTRHTGFTLIEVLVALFIVALTMGGLMAALSQAAGNTAYLRDRSFGQWIALNRITEVRLNAGNVPLGKTKGEVEFAGQKWRWRQEVVDTGIASLMRIDVGVQMAERKAPGDSTDVFTEALGKASGFIGRAQLPSNGTLPNWMGSPLSPVGSGQNPPVNQDGTISSSGAGALAPIRPLPGPLPAGGG
ncbi:MAG: type II secretion system minor pseudopilin GspI [Steroidobacteraceae bacterium]